jgi:hypothetical protein
VAEICKDGFLVNTETGEVVGECFEPNEVTQDHDLEHYSILPPIPANVTRLRQLAKENMKERGLFLKGTIDPLITKVRQIIAYLEHMYETLPA